MTTSYFDEKIKTDSKNSFYNLEAQQTLNIKPIANKSFYGIQNYFDKASYYQDFNREQYLRLTPVSLTNFPFISGANIDYNLPKVNGVYERF